LKLGNLGFRLFQNLEVRIGVFPECEEVLVGAASFGSVARDHVRAGKSEMRQCTERIPDRDSSVIHNFLKFRGGFGALVCG
jgi:hypothetical protein